MKLKKKMYNAITLIANHLYQKGTSEVYDFANTLGDLITYEDCKPCEASTPHVKHKKFTECLLCGQ